MNEKYLEEVISENKKLLLEVVEMKKMIESLQKKVISVESNTRPKSEYSSWDDFPY